jgi:2-C-methyl-D-erythritol 4-phosphate cytidylyltransferase / 2-C-methyl-D-erythritol 2,4-cyclodiphosphate synthase
MKCAVIIVGAGSGKRHGGDIPKQYQCLDGITVFRRTLFAFERHPAIDTIIAVIAKDALPYFEITADGLDVPFVIGGNSRTASVRAGLLALQDHAPDVVLIHDAARPFVSEALISKLIEVNKNEQGAAPGFTPTNALKQMDTDTHIGDAVSRGGLVEVQTPQAFPFKALLEAYIDLPENAAFADDLAIARSAGLPCTLVEGDPDNVKITRPGDLRRAEQFLCRQTNTVCVTGTGFDVHRIIPGPHMMLCGVCIKGELALKGHSDADAGLHALTDALLGTIGAGDIGDHFPPSDPQWKGVDSSVFLQKARELLSQRKARILHVDLTIIGERPKIKPYRTAMVARLSALLGLGAEQVSVKATTTEGLGFTGRGEGLAVMANASVQIPV